MALNKKYTILKYCLLILTVLLFSVIVLHKCEYSYYKIGYTGEYGEITIMKDYVILGHYASLCIPKSNYIRIPIKYDSSILAIEVTIDSMIHIAAYPEITSYELSTFKGVDTTICSELQQMLRDRTMIFKCIISTYGYGLYPTFYYGLSDSTIICQKYLQRFPWESPDKWCSYDTIILPEIQKTMQK